MTPELWPIQVAGIDGVRKARAAGFRRVCLTAPTGCGKTAIVAELIRGELAAGGRVSLYTNRTMLREQTSGVMADAGLAHGVRAAGCAPDFDSPFQVSSVQTEASRVTRRKVWDVHPATLVIVDEFHLFANDTWARLSNAHLDAGATVVGVTATPIGVGLVCDTLVVAGTTSDGRKCGALVPAYHYGSSEPWVPAAQKQALDRGEDLSEKETVKAVMRPGIFGLVFDEWKRLNPQGLPTILFGPGVAESLWFAQQFVERGVSAAHIDGENVWINGREYRSDRAARDAAMEGSRDGSVRVLCNRFVLREGIDAPWLAHGILATVFGSLQSYLQSGGRLLRAYDSLGKVTVQDHGGNWHRMGSLNADRLWDLSLTPAMIAGERGERLRKKKCGECDTVLAPGPVCQECGHDNESIPEPLLCPRCRCVLAKMVPGTACPACGVVFQAVCRSRPVVMEDGRLVEQAGDIYTPKVRKETADSTKKWVQCYFRTLKSGGTFRQAEGLFVHENGFYPLANLKFMPKTARGWYLRVADVPREELYS